jgi:transcription-repair coupling factor (superfamily II helicase)
MKKKRREKAAGHALPWGPEDEETGTVAIDLQVKAYIPAEYMEDESAKINFYQRINNARNSEDIEELRQEMTDRFGDLPAPLDNLLSIGFIKAVAKEAKIAGVCQETKQIKIMMAEEHGLKGPALMELVKNFNRRISFNATDKLEIVIQLVRLETQDVIGFLTKVVQALLTLVKQGETLV